MAFTQKLLILATFITIFGVLGFIYQDSSEFQFNEQNIQNEWIKWQKTHDKFYFSFLESKRRYEIFKQSYKYVSEHNKKYIKGEASYYLSLNSLAVHTSDEYKQLLGISSDLDRVKQNSKNEVILDESNLVSTVNWVDAGAVTPVKDQKNCGSCWAFSATGAMEGLNFIKNKKLDSFSEQQLIDCSGSYGNSGCNGGYMDDAFEYSQKFGLEQEKIYPYEANDDMCLYSEFNQLFKNSRGKQDVQKGSQSQLLAAIQKQPVSVGVQANLDAFRLYAGGILDDAAGCGTTIDHGVLAVGFGSENGKDYYLVKNSWGSKWGLNGYIKLERIGDGPGMCAIQQMASYPLE